MKCKTLNDGWKKGYLLGLVGRLISICSWLDMYEDFFEGGEGCLV